MVWTANQLTAFFEDPAQMCVPHETRNALQAEGMITIEDLSEFDKESIKQVADNLRRPGDRIADPNPDAAEGATIPRPPYIFGAKSIHRLIAATDIVRFYETVGRPLTPACMRWQPVIKSFMEHWKALSDRKVDHDLPEVPKVTKTLTITKWTEAMADYLQRVIGSRTIPLSYVIRKEADVPVAAPVLAANQPYSEEHGSVEDELIARASHTHALYQTDNAEVYYKIEEATRGTIYAASLKPYQRRKNGRDAWIALVRQYAGQDKWRAELKKQDELLHSRRWKGQQNFSLERFIAQHRNAFVSMTACAEHVDFQLPNELTRVNFLLDAIENNDAPLQAAMALVRNDTGVDGKMSNFEDTASFLLPHDPVAKKRTTSGKVRFAHVSDTHAHVEISELSAKIGIGKSGVSLRFHTQDEYRKLNNDQKEELRQYRIEQTEKGLSPLLPKAGKRNRGRRSNQDDDVSPSSKKFKSSVAKAVAKAMKAHEKEAVSDASDTAALNAYIKSLKAHEDASIGSSAALPPTPSDNPVSPPVPSKAVLNALVKKTKKLGI